MKNMFKVTIPLAIVVTLLAVVYQRATGPTYPKKIDIGKERNIRVKLPRSQGGSINAPVELPKLNPEMKASLVYKRYPTKDAWTEVPFKDLNNRLLAELPNQPPAGKLTYYLNIDYGNGDTQAIGSIEDPVYIRYKGEVPSFVLAPHVFFMFFSMLLSALCFFECLFKTDSYKLIGRLTLGSLIFGGMVLGPIVQKYAFDVYWAGFPFDWDLTDNKLLVGVLAWFFGVILSHKYSKRWPAIAAAVVLFGVYCIPHSMQGSEYDYDKGKVITDMD